MCIRDSLPDLPQDQVRPCVYRYSPSVCGRLSVSVCINARRPYLTVCYIVQPSTTLHWCRYRMYCIYVNIPCEGDVGLRLPVVTGQEAPGHLRRASHHPRDARLARWLQVHRLDEVSCRPSMCVAIRLCEWSPLTANRDCHIGVIRMSLSVHHIARPTGNSSLTAGGTRALSQTSDSLPNPGWRAMSR